MSDVQSIAQCYVYDASNNTVIHKHSCIIYPVQAFNLMFSTQKIADGNKLVTNYLRYFMENDLIETVAGMVYDPSQPKVFEREGVRYLNSFNGLPDLSNSYNSGVNIQDLIDRWMFSITGEWKSDKCQNIIQSLAYIIQNPGKKLNFALLIQGDQASGKSTIFDVMTKLLGKSNTKAVKPKQLKSENYNDWEAGSMFACIEEIKEQGESRLNVYNSIKDAITSQYVTIIEKYRRPVSVPNCQNFLLCTNYTDAIKLDADDRRFYVVLGKQLNADQLIEGLGINVDYATSNELLRKRKARETFFGQYFRPVLDNFPGDFREYFESVDLSDFDPKSAPANQEDKELLDASSATGTDQEIQDYIDSEDDPWVMYYVLSATALYKGINENRSSADMIKQNQIHQYLKNNNYLSTRIRINGERNRIWFKANLTNSEFKEEINCLESNTRKNKF